MSNAIWSCLQFHALALEVFLPRHGQAVAVIEQEQVYGCSQAAQENGIEAGMSTTTALALSDALQVYPRNHSLEQQALKQLLASLYQFTPCLTIYPPNSVLMELGSCQRLHGNLAALLEQMSHVCQSRGYHPVAGVAATPKAAQLLCHYRQQAAYWFNHEGLDHLLVEQHIQQAPTEWLAVSEQDIANLKRVGLETLGDLQALPDRELATRFDRHFLQGWQQLQGLRADPQCFYQPPTHYDESLAFDEGIQHQHGLLFPIKTLLQSLCLYLRTRDCLSRYLHWSFYGLKRQLGEIRIELNSESRDWQSMWELTRLRLEQWHCKEPVLSLQLQCDRFIETPAAAESLFPELEKNAADINPLLDRLRARIGDQAIEWPQGQASHLPELAGYYRPQKNTPPITAKQPMPFRPAWLLAKPVPLQFQQQQLQWQRPLQLLRGPERIDGEWWRPRHSCRDYFIASDDRGACYWVYREQASQRWYLHGLFA